ncbi:MAG: zinc-binding dehydrogenase, partial [Bacillota bacterium]|nr:zinc-binding dehydrogenase [Bacillota bacterium]
RVAEIQRLTGGMGADVVLEVAGVPAALIDGLNFVKPGGRYISIGNVNVGEDYEVSISPGLITRKSAHIIGVVRYNPWYLYKALKFLERNVKYPFDKLSDKSYSLNEVGEVLARADRREITRAMIEPSL